MTRSVGRRTPRRRPTSLALFAGLLMTSVMVTALATVACAEERDPPPAAWRPIDIQATPVNLHQDDATVRRVGRLHFLAAYDLDSPDEDFGGFSGLLIDGECLIAVSDKGQWLRAHLVLAADGTLAGLDQAEMAPVRDQGGVMVDGRDRQDAEELTRQGGDLLVSFEGEHRIHRYELRRTELEPIVIDPPPGFDAAAANGGLEAMTELADGELFLLSENFYDADYNLRGWIGDGVTWRPFSLATDAGFMATAASTLPDGDVLYLTRFYVPVLGAKVQVRRLPKSVLEAASAGVGPLEGTPVALLEPPFIVDNFEALEVTTGADGRLFVYLLSDDNFRDAQRTLLLQFELRGSDAR